jgi:hypothetical protein
MIGYDRLGTNGRFGNQLFQYAALRGIAAKHNYDWCIPPDDHPTTANYAIHHPFKLKNLTEKNIGLINNNTSLRATESFESLRAYNPEKKNVIESGFDFDENLFNTCEDNTNLDGFFQTEKYFKHIEQEIREDFEFIDGILNPCKEFIDQFEKIIFIHVRRGDAIGREEYHPVPTLNYYEQALTYFDDDVNVLICSDDIEWVKEQEFFSDDRFLISENQETYSIPRMEGDGNYRKSLVPYTDLCLMTLCNGAIISPSSLSWWGAWLQKNRTNPIIAPSPWFGPKLSHNNTKDILPDDWIKLSW